MARAVLARPPPEQLLKLAFQGPQIANVLIDLADVVSRKLTDALAWCAAVTSELQKLFYVLEAHAEALRPADEIEPA
jgi:hypothetical protein